MRYTRMGKPTHQRVPDEPSTWEDLKSTPAKPQRNRNEKGRGGFSKNGDRNNGKNFDRFGKNRQQRFSNNRGEEESANFVAIGDRPGQKKNAMGSVEGKRVRVHGNLRVPAEDSKRFIHLAIKLKEQGLKKKEVYQALKIEQRKTEKTARRGSGRDKTCFNCRQFGHILENCPNLKSNNSGQEGEGGEDATTINNGDTQMSCGICFKCGSLEHMSRDCKKKADKFDFAKCFVCSQTGHISRQCPKNAKGRFPAGGACKICDDVTHFAKDCPKGDGNQEEKVDDTPIIPRMTNPFVSPECEESPIDDQGKAEVQPKAKNRKVKF